jgi:opacity protein-like surface antigen
VFLMTTRLILLLTATTVLGGAAQAQTITASTPPQGGRYVQFVAHSAFGDAPSQSYGAELGINVWRHVQVFAVGGRTSNVAPLALGDHAQLIAGYLQRTQNGAISFMAEEPVAYGAAGLRYVIPTRSRAEPYVMGGAGVANVSRNVHFLVAGADVTSNMASYGVTLGSDLSGSATNPILHFGGGVTWPLWKPLRLDFQYRFGRIFAGDRRINTQLAGAGLGVWF